MAQCWCSYEVRKWKMQGAVLLIAAGDAAIEPVSAALSEGRRRREILGRVGGMVVVVLCPSLSLIMVPSQIVLPAPRCSLLTLPYCSLCEVMQNLLALLLSFCLERNKQKFKAK